MKTETTLYILLAAAFGYFFWKSGKLDNLLGNAPKAERSALPPTTGGAPEVSQEADIPRSVHRASPVRSQSSPVSTSANHPGAGGNAVPSLPQQAGLMTPGGRAIAQTPVIPTSQISSGRRASPVGR